MGILHNDLPAGAPGRLLITVHGIRTFGAWQTDDARCPRFALFFWANLGSGSFWQKRYYDRNVRDALEFNVKLRYLHLNPVNRGPLKEPGDWKWSSFRHYAFRERDVVDIESEWTGRDRELKISGGPLRIFLCPD